LLNYCHSVVSNRPTLSSHATLTCHPDPLNSVIPTH